jgi:tRNA G46 methylase TrmB
MNLDLIGIRTGTDKSRLRHDYLRKYERLFERFVNKSIVLLEIGIHNGASLMNLEHYFTNANIVGIVLNPLVLAMQKNA